MASKVIGFRIPEDIAEELEKVSEERGMTIAEFMRKLVDETLYATTDSKGQEKSDTAISGQLQSLLNEQERLSNQVHNLSDLMTNIMTKNETYKTEGILSPEQVETMQEVANLTNQVNTWEYKHNTLLNVLNENSKKTQDILALVNKNKESVDHTYDELRKEVSQLRSQLETVTVLPLKVKQLESEMTRTTTNISSLKRDVKRQPTDETHTLTYEDGSDHTFRVYKSPAGLVKPHVVVRDLILGKKYVDLTEPLD